MKLTRILLAALTAASLVACGGGGGDAPPPIAAGPADKYVGTWGICQAIANAQNGAKSARIDWVFTKTAPAAASVSVDGSAFSGAACSGTVINAINGLATGTATIVGTKKIGNDTVDLVDFAMQSATISELNGAGKEIALISGTTLKMSTESALDAQGYPTVLDNINVFTKR